MSLCLCRVCMRAALREAVPGALVYSAILSFTPVSYKKQKIFQLLLTWVIHITDIAETTPVWYFKTTVLNNLNHSDLNDMWKVSKWWIYSLIDGSLSWPTWRSGLTLANNCSISTDMVSNILSWVELFSSGVVSDLEEKEKNENN